MNATKTGFEERGLKEPGVFPHETGLRDPKPKGVGGFVYTWHRARVCLHLVGMTS